MFFDLGILDFLTQNSVSLDQTQIRLARLGKVIKNHVRIPNFGSYGSVSENLKQGIKGF